MSHASARAAVIVAGAFAVSAGGCAWLLVPLHQPALLWAVAGLHGGACVVALLALSALRRGLLKTRAQLAIQLDAIGRGLMEERVQSGAQEWAPLSSAINVMVVRLAAQIADRDRRLGELQTEVSIDELTGLAARAQFMDRLSGLLHAPDVGATGGVVLLRIDDLAGVNQRTGRDRTDEMLRSVATLLRVRVLRLAQEGALVARLNGADFAAVVPLVDADKLDAWTRELSDALHGLKQQQLTDRPRVGWLAASIFHPGESPGAVLSRVDRALQAGEAGNTPWQLVKAQRSGPAVSLAQWRGILDEALITGRIELAFSDVCRADGRLHHRMGHVRVHGADERVFDSDEVLPAALRTGRIADIDLRSAELALAAIGATGVAVSLKLSARSAERPAFVSRLDTALAEAGGAARQLWMEVDTSAEQDVVAVLAPLAATLARHGVHLGLDHVVAPPENLAPLRRLGVSYLRLAPAMAGGLAGDGSSGKRLLLQLMAEIGETEGLELLAGAAVSAADAEVLRGLGIAAQPHDAPPPAPAAALPRNAPAPAAQPALT